MRLLPGARLVSSPASAARRRCDASSRARTAGSSRPRHSRCRSPSAARSRASDRSCRRGCGNSGCRTRPRRRTRRTARSRPGCRRSAFHQVNSEQKSFHGRCAVAEWRRSCQLGPAAVKRVKRGAAAVRGACAILEIRTWIRMTNGLDDVRGWLGWLPDPVASVLIILLAPRSSLCSPAHGCAGLVRRMLRAALPGLFSVVDADARADAARAAHPRDVRSRCRSRRSSRSPRCCSRSSC